MTIKRFSLALLVIAALSGASSQVLAQATTDAKAAAKSELNQLNAQAKADDVEPAAIEALKSMGEFLNQQKAIDLTNVFSVDFVLDSGQTIEIGGTAHYLARRPDRLKLDLSTDLGNRSLTYDGKSLYVYSPDDNVYGQLDEVGATLKDMMDSVSYYADIDIPLADLFSWANDGAPVDQIKSAFRVGRSVIDGNVTDHYAYRTDDKDIELWLSEAEPGQPIKLVIADSQAEKTPRFEADLTWLTTEVTDANFQFTPPEGATEIPILVRDATDTGEETKK